jgi:hypothetical protein
VSFNSQVCIIFIYNLLQIFNFDKLVMLRENSKNFTYAFCKSGALHEASKKPVDSPPKSSHFVSSQQISLSFAELAVYCCNKAKICSMVQSNSSTTTTFVVPGI